MQISVVLNATLLLAAFVVGNCKDFNKNGDDRDLVLLEHLVKAIEYEVEDLKEIQQINKKNEHEEREAEGSYGTTENTNSEDMSEESTDMTAETSVNETTKETSMTVDVSATSTAADVNDAKKEVDLQTSLQVGDAGSGDHEADDDNKDIHISFDISSEKSKPEKMEGKIPDRINLENRNGNNETLEEGTNEVYEKESQDQSEFNNTQVEAQLKALSRDVEQDDHVLTELYDMEMKMGNLQEAVASINQEMEKVAQEIQSPGNSNQDLSKKFKWPWQKPKKPKYQNKN